MDRLKDHLLPILILGLLVSLAVGFRSFLVSNIIEPVAFLFWAVWGIFASVNQNLCWTILIVVCSILALRLVPPGKDTHPRSAYNYRYKSPNQVQHWQTLIRDSALGREQAEQLRDRLRNLFTSVVTQVEKSNATDLEDTSSTRKTPLSLRAQRLLFPPERREEASSISHRLDVVSLTPKWLRRWAGRIVRQDTASINEILEWMEHEMEISHDR